MYYKRDEAKQRKKYENTSFGPRPKRIHIHIVLPTWPTKEQKKEDLCSGNHLLIPSPETDIKSKGIIVLLQHIIISTYRTIRKERVS